jgi:hypothetical protein
LLKLGLGADTISIYELNLDAKEAMSYNPYQNDVSPSRAPGPQFNAEAAKSKAFPPGIALIVIGAIGLLGMGAYFFLTMYLFNTQPEMYAPPPGTDEGPHYFGVYMGFAGLAINALLQIIVILAGVSMVKGKGYGMALTGSIVSVIPCCGSSLCLLGIPFGIWALVVLSDANVKRLIK